MENTKHKQIKLKNSRGLMILFVSLLLSISSISQEVLNFETVKPISDNQAKTGSIDLYSLYYDNHTSLIISSKKPISLKGEFTSRVVEINVSDLNLLNDKTYNLSNIELIRVIYNQSDKKAVLDLSKIATLSNLKAIVFQCDFNCNPNQVESLITSKTEIIIPIYYLVSIPQ